MRSLLLPIAVMLVVGLPTEFYATQSAFVTLTKAELADRFLLQVSYEQRGPHEGFRTSRSRIVRFTRDGAALRMLDVAEVPGAVPERALASIPIRRETSTTFDLDLNAGFDTIDSQEDRTGEDYYGRVDQHDDGRIRLSARRALSVARHGQILVFDQKAVKDDGERVVVHYYLRRYEPDPGFQPFEMKNLERFGFYETYPRQDSGRWVLNATKFDNAQPIVFALSSAIPSNRRGAMRDGALYWNKAFGVPLVQVIDAPPGIRAPSPDYNVIQWVSSGDFESTSYLQSDPLTGQILHAHIFVLPETMMDGDQQQQNDHLRYIVAHEVGHALGLRHNFAAGTPTTVMGYFPLSQLLRIGRSIRMGGPALAYDRAVVSHVYLGVPLNLATLPAFCTDSQEGCLPFRVMEKESEGMRGD